MHVHALMKDVPKQLRLVHILHENTCFFLHVSVYIPSVSSVGYKWFTIKFWESCEIDGKI